MAEKKKLSRSALKFFRETGRKGGIARAKKYGPTQRREWAKKGGRPPIKGKRKTNEHSENKE